MVSAAAFRLKGGGWYETDFKSGNKKNVAGDVKTQKEGAGKAQSKDQDKSKAASSKKPSGDSGKTKKAKS